MNIKLGGPGLSLGASGPAGNFMESAVLYVILYLEMVTFLSQSLLQYNLNTCEDEKGDT